MIVSPRGLLRWLGVSDQDAAGPASLSITGQGASQILSEYESHVAAIRSAEHVMESLAARSAGGAAGGPSHVHIDSYEALLRKLASASAPDAPHLAELHRSIHELPNMAGALHRFSNGGYGQGQQGAWGDEEPLGAVSAAASGDGAGGRAGGGAPAVLAALEANRRAWRAKFDRARVEQSVTRLQGRSLSNNAPEHCLKGLKAAAEVSLLGVVVALLEACAAFLALNLLLVSATGGGKRE